MSSINKPARMAGLLIMGAKDQKPAVESVSHGESKMLKRDSIIRSKKLYVLTIGGGLVFWATTIATSLFPIAAEYRAHYTNWKLQTVWVDSLLVGMIIGFCVSYSLLRFMKKNPTRNPIQKSTILSFIALVIAIILIDVPQSFLLPGSNDALYYFLIGVMFNAARFLLLGSVIGYLYSLAQTGVARAK